MLAVTRPESLQRAERSATASVQLVAIPTCRGTYFVPGDLASMQTVLRQEGLRAADLLRQHPDFQPLLRRLFLLACQESLAPGRGRCIRDMVRALRRS